MEIDLDLLTWLSTFLNFLILAYLSLNIVNTSCFNLFQLTLSFIGLIASIFVNIVSVVLKK